MGMIIKGLTCSKERFVSYSILTVDNTFVNYRTKV